jgi:hypothetical protein
VAATAAEVVIPYPADVWAGDTAEAEAVLLYMVDVVIVVTGTVAEDTAEAVLLHMGDVVIAVSGTVAVDTVGAVMPYTADTAMAAPDALATVEDTEGITTEDLHQGGRYTVLFSVEWLLAASSAPSGGLTTPYRCLRPITTRTISIHILHLLISFRFRPLKPRPLIPKILRRRQRRRTNVMRPKPIQAVISSKIIAVT